MYKKSAITLIVSLSLFILLTNITTAAPAEKGEKANKGTSVKEEKVVPQGSAVKEQKAVKVENKGLIQKIKEKVTGREQVKEEKQLKACERVENRLGAKTAQYEKNKQGHLVAYGNARNRLQKFISKYEESGYDVTKLKTDLTALDEKIAAFKIEYDGYIAELQAAKQKPCVEEQAEYVSTMATVKEKLADLRTSSVAIKEFFNEVIKPDLLEVRQQIADETEEETEEEVEEGTESSESEE